MNFMAIGKLALKHWQSIALAGLLSWSWIQGQRIDNLKEQAGGYERSIQAHEDAARRNDAAIERCVAVNLENARQIDRQMRIAREAERRVADLMAELDIQAALVPVEVEDFNDETCRTLDEPLPADFVDWLRDT